MKKEQSPRKSLTKISLSKITKTLLLATLLSQGSFIQAQQEQKERHLQEELSQKDFIEKVLDRVMTNISKNARLSGPIYHHNKRNEELYGDKIARIILKNAHRYAKRYLREGNAKAYYAFLILSLTVPNTEGLMVHFREVEASDEYCNDDRAQGNKIKSSKARRHFRKALNGKVSLFKKRPSFLVKCDELKGQRTYRQMIVGGSDGSDVGMFQLSSLWHYDNFLRKKKFQSVEKTIAYGIGYLSKGFKRGLRSNRRSRPCFFENNGQLNYKKLIRGTWSSYNGGPAKICRFANQESPFVKHDEGFLRDLDKTFNINKEGGFFGFSADSSLSLSPEVQKAIDEILRNFERGTRKGNALRKILKN